MYRVNCRHQNDDNVHVQTRPLEAYFSACEQFYFTLKIYTGINESAGKPVPLSHLHFIYFYNMKNFSTYLEEYTWVGGKVVEQRYQEGEEKKRRKRRNERSRKKWEIGKKRRKKMM